MAGRSRTPNMRAFEDEILCHSYIKITTNPIIGNSQPGAKFWSSIESNYNAHPDIVIKRGGGSLQTRFSTISQAVMLYASKISQIYGSVQGSGSGTNELDWINRAHQEYQQHAGKPFVFDNCYQILKDLPKFDTNTTRINTQRFTSDGNETSSPGTPTTPIASLNLSDDVPIDIESPADRPQGRKGEKQRQKRKSRAASVSSNNAVVESVEKFATQYQQNVEDTRQSRIHFQSQMDELIKIKKDEIEIRKEDREIKLRKEEDLIMSTDTTNLTYQQQQYYKMRFEEILQRRQRQALNPGSSSAPI